LIFESDGNYENIYPLRVRLNVFSKEIDKKSGCIIMQAGSKLSKQLIQSALSPRLICIIISKDSKYINK
jgi:hypothetical protein